MDKDKKIRFSDNQIAVLEAVIYRGNMHKSAVALGKSLFSNRSQPSTTVRSALKSTLPKIGRVYNYVDEKGTIPSEIFETEDTEKFFKKLLERSPAYKEVREAFDKFLDV